jgi:hypothetical protein
MDTSNPQIGVTIRLTDNDYAGPRTLCIIVTPTLPKALENYNAAHFAKSR